jgi:hypothetical protein
LFISKVSSARSLKETNPKPLESMLPLIRFLPSGAFDSMFESKIMMHYHFFVKVSIASMPEQTYKDVENHLAFGKDVFDSFLKGSDRVTDWADKTDAPDLPHGVMQRVEGAFLREFHAFLKAKDPGFGGLIRVLNKRQEFLWVHERFAGEY